MNNGIISYKTYDLNTVTKHGYQVVEGEINDLSYALLVNPNWCSNNLLDHKVGHRAGPHP